MFEPELKCYKFIGFLFGPGNIKDLDIKTIPMALTIFCHRNDIGFMGDHFGVEDKFCNDFFPTPSDAGICLTKNLDMKDILKAKKEYDGLFQPHLQNPSMKIVSGTDWGEISLILIPRQSKHKSPVRKKDAKQERR